MTTTLDELAGDMYHGLTADDLTDMFLANDLANIWFCETQLTWQQASIRAWHVIKNMEPSECMEMHCRSVHHEHNYGDPECSYFLVDGELLAKW